MTQRASAATRRRSIGRQLKAARETFFPNRARKELPLTEAAAALHVSPRTIRRLEGGEVKPSYLLVSGACHLYRLEAEATARLLEMVEQADEDEWHEKYRQDITRGWSSSSTWRPWRTACTSSG
ncbi:helix-turn-helix transcriptional regulator [Kineosporia rhizophila]|uniref:helix-turn-helix domain-containing protein n=1 Tax=Kineosporia rhizophila TaxID=84633 RepID=UPI001E5852A5|nr:helix-turn-helix transcriptional regulator [Kineosporia rhizophila]MCE0538644.1 helix-turn-helix transcriptional regulator [Kineosporia rhizophila]